MLNFQYRQKSNISYKYWNTTSANNRAIECMFTTVTNAEENGLSFHEGCKTLKMYPAESSLFDSSLFDPSLFDSSLFDSSL